MRKLISFWLVFMFAIYSYAQQNPVDTLKTREYYLGKSRSQKTAGWVMLGVGGAAALAGVIAQTAQVSLYIVSIGTTSNNSNAPAILMIAGGACMLGSIPLFISSHDNKMKAMELSIAPKMEENGALIRMYAGKYQPAISLTIKFR